MRDFEVHQVAASVLVQAARFEVLDGHLIFYDESGDRVGAFPAGIWTGCREIKVHQIELGGEPTTGSIIDSLNAICDPFNLPGDVRAITLKASVDEIPTLTVERVILQAAPLGAIVEQISEVFELHRREDE